MTLKHETKLYAGPSDLCESISKIILFAEATHFRLPPPIMALSGEDDRLQLREEQGRFCSIRHRRPPRPQSPPFINITSSFTFDSSWAAAYITNTEAPFVEAYYPTLYLDVVISQSPSLENNNGPNKSMMPILQCSFCLFSLKSWLRHIKDPEDGK